MKNENTKACLVAWIILLFIFSTITPLAIGYDTEIADGELMDNLAYDCYNEYGFSKINYYREHFLIQSSEAIESEEVEKTFELPSTGQYNGPMDSPWPMKCQNNRHTGLSPYSTADNYGVEKWRFRTDGWIEGGPAIDKEGNIYFGCFDYYLYSLYPNGTLRWKFKTNNWIWSTPSIDKDGTIYIGTYGAKLYAINLDGTLKWKFSAGNSISSSPVIGENRTVYFGTMGFPENGCRIYAVSTNGTEKWHFNTGYKIVSDPAIADDGTIYIGSGDSYLYAIYPNGTLRWRFKTGDYIKSHPSIAEDGTIIFDSFDNYLYALFPNGTMKWKLQIDSSGGGSTSIGPDGTLFKGGNSFYAINTNGSIKWIFNIGNDNWIGHSSPALSADGIIYIGTHIGSGSWGEIITINPDGTERWRKKIADEWVDSSPCIGEDGTVYIGVSNTDSGNAYGYLYAFGRGEFNQPPNPPSINGPIIGLKNKRYAYNFTLDDPELDDIEFFVDWDDGNNTGWLGPFDSGETLTLTHSWSEKGTYTVKAKARDTYDSSESNWSTLTVSMPKSSAIFIPFLNFLENHPRMLPFLRQLLGL